MSLRINTNVASIAAQRALTRSQRDADKALRALSSGTKLNQPGGDPAGLAMSEQLRGQIVGIRAAKSNAENAISLVQVAEGGLNEQTNILVRLRELGVQAASDTVSDDERSYLNEEFTQLVEEFDRIAESTTYGSTKLLVGSGDRFEYHVGPNSGSENIISYTMDADSTASKMGVSGLSVADQDDARDTLGSIDEALNKISAIRASFGSIQSRLTHAQSNLEVQYENVSAARSRISDTDVAEETANLVQATVAQDAGIAVLSQASQLPKSAGRLIGMM